MQFPGVMLVVATGIATALATTAQAQPTGAALTERIDAIARTALDSPQGAGLSVAVLQGGNVLLEKGYGYADLEWNVPADGATMFRIGSITKQFTAALVMRRVETGELSLDDPLTKFFPDWPAPGEQVTIRHLLNHTSGIKSNTEIEAFMKTAGLDRSNDELLAVFRDEPWDFQPGADWSYNNSGYTLLTIILEQVGGDTWANQVNALAAELGLTRTRADSNREILKNRAQGYAWEDDGLANDAWISPVTPGGAGALISTAGDLVRWSEMLATGKVVSQESYEAMLAPVTLPDSREVPYGFGLQLEPLEAQPAVSHGGGIFGFNSELLRLPEQEGLTIAVISNSESLRAGQVAMHILGAALGRAEPEAAPVADDMAAAVVGTFLVEQVNLEVRVFLQNGALQTQAAGQPPFPMIHEGGGVFRLDLPQRIELAFDLSASPAPKFTLRQGGAELMAARIAPE